MITRILTIFSIFLTLIFSQAILSDEISLQTIVSSDINQTKGEGGSSGATNPLKDDIDRTLNAQQALDLNEWLNARLENFTLDSLLRNFLHHR